VDERPGDACTSVLVGEFCQEKNSRVKEPTLLMPGFRRRITLLLVQDLGMRLNDPGLW